MRRLIAAGTLAAATLLPMMGATVASAAASAAPSVPAASAAAASKYVFAHVDSPRGDADSGAAAEASLRKTSSTSVIYANARVNDECGGDYYGAWGRAIAKTSSGMAYGRWHKDVDGCSGLPPKTDWGVLRTSGAISQAGVQVCLYDGNTRIKCDTDYTSF